MKDEQVNRPQQKRSRQTMTKMLEAAEQLLEDKSWSELTIQEVVQTAGTSVGAFYGRFKDKNGLLHALDERYFERISVVIESVLERTDWPSLSLEEICLEMARLVVDIHGRQQGVMRTLILQARLENDPRFRQREGRLMDYLPAVGDIILPHAGEINHPDPIQALRFGYLQLFYTAREMSIWPHLAEGMPYQGDALAGELARNFFNYLHHSF